MRYNIKFEKKALKQLKKLDVTQQRMILSWIDKNLQNTDNPKFIGSPLKGHLREYWRYRIGDYRIIVNIKNHELLIVVIQIGHRKDIYKN